MNFLIDLASHPSFQSGDVHTGFIDQHFNSLFPPIQISPRTVTQAVAALLTNELNSQKQNSMKQQQIHSSFDAFDSFRVNSKAIRTFELESNGKTYDIQLKRSNANYQIKIDDSDWKSCEIYSTDDPNPNRFTMKLNLDGVQSTFSAVVSSENIDIFNEVNSKEKIIIEYWRFAN